MYFVNITCINTSNEGTLTSSICFSLGQPGNGVKKLDLNCFWKPVTA